MKSLGIYQYKAVYDKAWGYVISDLSGNVLMESHLTFDSKVNAELAAIGHITLIEREKIGDNDV